MARFYKGFELRRLFRLGRWKPHGIRQILTSPLPMCGDPSFKCPETGEQVTVFICDTCPLYERWGGSDIRSCKHDYEKRKAIDKEDLYIMEETITENELTWQRLQENAKEAAGHFQEHQKYLESLNDLHEDLYRRSYEEFHRDLDELAEAALNPLILDKTEDLRKGRDEDADRAGKQDRHFAEYEAEQKKYNEGLNRVDDGNSENWQEEDEEEENEEDNYPLGYR